MKKSFDFLIDLARLALWYNILFLQLKKNYAQRMKKKKNFFIARKKRNVLVSP